MIPVIVRESRIPSSTSSSEEVKSIQLIMKVTCESDDVKISEEHDEFGWFSQEEVDAMIDEGLLTPPAANAFKK